MINPRSNTNSLDQARNNTKHTNTQTRHETHHGQRNHQTKYEKTRDVALNHEKTPNETKPINPTNKSHDKNEGTST